MGNRNVSTRTTFRLSFRLSEITPENKSFPTGEIPEDGTRVTGLDTQEMFLSTQKQKIRDIILPFPLLTLVRQTKKMCSPLVRSVLHVVHVSEFSFS